MPEQADPLDSARRRVLSTRAWHRFIRRQRERADALDDPPEIDDPIVMTTINEVRPCHA